MSRTSDALRGLRATFNIVHRSKDNAPRRRNWRRFEPLEGRHLLVATLWVDPNVASGGNIFATIGAAVAAAHNGDTVKVVAGTYGEAVDIDKSLTIVGGRVRAVGEPTGTSIVNPGLGTGFVLNAANVTIKNFTIQGSIGGIKTSSSFGGYKILGNTFFDDAVGIALATSLVNPATTMISGNKFTNNTVGLATADGILCQEGARNVMITGNSFAARSTDSAININAASQSVNVQILNNVWPIIDGGIVVANATKFKVSGNTIYAQTPDVTPIHFAGAVTNSQVAGNMLHKAAASNATGIDLSQDLVATPNTSNKITGNIVDGFFQGITVRNSTQNTISSNVITNSNSGGIRISMSSTSNTVAMNSVSQCLYGIDIQSDGNTVSKNTVTGTHNVGINVVSSQNTISGNSVSHNDSNGIVVMSILQPLTQNKINGNTVNFNGGGIRVEFADDCTISGNVANSNQNNGIDVSQGSHNVVSRNTANGNYVLGITVNFENFDTISKNTANHNLFGFTISADNTTLTGNTANNNLGSGFGVSGNMDTVKGNFANNNVLAGLVVGGSNGTVSQNVAKANGLVGIELDTTNSSVSGNLALNNSGNGIQLGAMSSGNTISGNMAMGNGDALGGFDLFDASTGGGTAATANTWAGNKAKTRSPAGLL